jgi:ADP-L-glycero-D-manno-heptose 6-epimerase
MAYSNSAMLGEGKILVTGGAGFIGSALVWALNSRGIHDILVCDHLGSDDKWRNLLPLIFDDFITPDDLLASISSTDLAWPEVRWVLHLGACSATTERDLGFLLRNNYGFTKQLCEWALRREIRFVYASSAATYGDGFAGMIDDEQNIARLRPLNGYGYSKQLFDLHANRRGYLSKIVGLKYFNVFGPNESHKGDQRSLVNKAFEQVQQTGKIQLFKSYRPEFRDGEQQRDFLYVKDAVEMTLHLATAHRANGIFNLGSGQARTWIDLANAVFAAVGAKPQIEFIPMPKILQGKYQYFTQADIRKLRNTGYEGPRFSLETAVTDYVQNYLLHDKHLEAEDR